MQYIDNFLTTHFWLVWFLCFGFALTFNLVNGRKAYRLFSDLDYSKVIYTKRMVSGYSTKSIWTKLGGARNVLEVLVTDTELIIKTNMFFASIASRYDLLHRIPLNKILTMEVKPGNVQKPGLHITFKGKHDKLKEVVIMSKDVSQILAVLQKALLFPQSA